MECIFCKQTTDSPLEYGEMYTQDDVTVHYFCLLLASNLLQNGAEDEGIHGFLIADIKAEVKRTKKLLCCYCRENGACIGCCGVNKNGKECQRSFHLPCALAYCRFDFRITSYQSFCHTHSSESMRTHKQSQKCAICWEKIGKYDKIRSIQSPCCDADSWYHKQCLMKLANKFGYDFKCPLCKNTEIFRSKMQSQGIFIPDRDADLEETEDEASLNASDHLLEDIELIGCMAQECKSPYGRHYHEFEDSNYFWLFCEGCGSSAVHRCCSKDSTRFACDICDSILNDNQIDISDVVSTNDHAESEISDVEIGEGIGNRIKHFIGYDGDVSADNHTEIENSDDEAVSAVINRNRKLLKRKATEEANNNIDAKRLKLDQ